MWPTILTFPISFGSGPQNFIGEILSRASVSWTESVNPSIIGYSIPILGIFIIPTFVYSYPPDVFSTCLLLVDEACSGTVSSGVIFSTEFSLFASSKTTTKTSFLSSSVSWEATFILFNMSCETSSLLFLSYSAYMQIDIKMHTKKTDKKNSNLYSFFFFLIQV